MHAKIVLNRDFVIGRPDEMLFGSFIEHLGRAVYGGIYEPTHPTADSEGFRGDVADMIRDLKVSCIRYPGGNFVSGYNWEDGIGPRDKRPAVTDLAWFSVEPNQVGTDEFLSYCKRIGCEPILAVNLGDAGMKEARNLIEYTNLKGGTLYSDLRIRNGCAEPHRVRYLCLGNEMDGQWQIGHKTPYEYGRLAHETAKTMRMVDPDIRLIACGSSGYSARTFPEWEHTVLDECYESVDYLSMHEYFRNFDGDTASFLASGHILDRFIGEAIAACDYIKSKKRSGKTMMFSFDEYNVWYHSKGESYERFTVAPAILEDIYHVADAVALGGAVISLLRHCDRVKIACLAQLVNVIAPIMTVNGGIAWRQTIYYPFRDFSHYGRGTILHTPVASDTCACKKYGELPALDAVAIADDYGGVTVLAVNRSMTEPLDLSLVFQGFSVRADSHTSLCDPDIYLTNSPEHPCRVVPRAMTVPVTEDGRSAVTLPPVSWNVIRFAPSQPQPFNGRHL